MKDLVKRRFKKGNKNLTPDLILVDGGPVQLNIVNTTMKELGFLKTHVIALSKGYKRKSQNDSLHVIGKSRINLDTASQSHKFLQIVRDEAHRFAIDNLKKKRVKLLKKSSMDEIPGIGQGKRRALIRYFGSVEKISYASISELEKVPGIGQVHARSISMAFKR
jgi:excinuclease ABC subunit C